MSRTCQLVLRAPVSRRVGSVVLWNTKTGGLKLVKLVGWKWWMWMVEVVLLETGVSGFS